MDQQYFIVVVAHSLHGRLRRLHVPHHIVYAILALALLGCFSLAGIVSSYARMAWKVANYNSLRKEVESLRSRYQTLQKVAHQTNQDLATLQLFADEVSIAYGIKQQLEGPKEIATEGRLVPTFSESLETYNFLKGASLARLQRPFAARWHVNNRPQIWPVDGRLTSYFGRRDDPFMDMRAFHTGVDITAPAGTAVRATADGIVTHAEWASGYGRLVVVDHGRGVSTYYAHLSRFNVVAGQEVRQGDIVGAVGSSGRAQSSHLHYEVRQGGTPVNPYPYMKATLAQVRGRRDFPF